MSSLSSLRLTVHPQFFRPVTFRLTNESHLVYPRYWSSSSHCCVLVWWSSSLSFGYWFSPRVWIPVGRGSRPLFSLRNIAWCSRPWCIDGRISTKNSPRGRPHWSGSFKFKGPQGGLFPEAPPGESEPAKEFAGLSVWQPHTKVNTQRGKRVLSLGGLFCGASGARPPSLSCFLWGFPFLGTGSATW